MLKFTPINGGHMIMRYFEKTVNEYLDHVRGKVKDRERDKMG